MSRCVGDAEPFNRSWPPRAIAQRAHEPSQRPPFGRYPARVSFQKRRASRRTFPEDFCSRTVARHFDVIDGAAKDNEVFAAWTASLTFRSGITIAGVTQPRDVEVPLRGAERFVVGVNGRIVELHIVHETTSVAQAHRAAAAAEQEA